MSQKDPALPCIGSEFYSDERVMLMTYEQQGVYLRLLAIAARNGSVPADLGLLAQLLRLPAKRFASRVWPAIALCWQVQGDRMVPAGGGLVQEDASPTSPPPHEPTSDRTEAEREADRIRQQRKRDRDAGRDVTHVTRDASRSVTRDVTRSVVPSGTPSVPLRVLKSVGPFCSAGEYQRGTEGANTYGDAEGPEALRRALTATAYRSHLPAQQRSREVTRKAVQLHLERMTVDQLQQLVELDAKWARKGPGSLLATWIDRHQWVDVLAKESRKDKEAGIRKRAAAAAGDAEEIPPLFAASVANDLLMRQRQ